MESEEAKGSHLAGRREQGHEQGHNEELAHASDEAKECARDKVVHNTYSQEVLRLVRLVKENAVFVCVNSAHASEIIGDSLLVEMETEHFQEQLVVEAKRELK